MSGLLIAALALGLAMLSGKKKSTTTVTFGPAVLKKSPVKVKLLPAVIKPAPKSAVKVKLGPAKIKPVQVVVPTSVHDTTATAVKASQVPGVAPIPNATAARKLAQPVADHVRNNRKKYDHGRVSTFQAFAGIKSDGLYGPQTAKALRTYGAKNVVA